MGGGGGTSKKIVRFQAKNGTDLTVNVEGMTWINCSGRGNFPDGEVFTKPNLKAAGRHSPRPVRSFPCAGACRRG